MAEHDSLGMSRCPRGIDQHTALVGLLRLNDFVELSIWNIFAKGHELTPLCI